METAYPITIDGESVGTAQILREGLFLQIKCLCQTHYEEDTHIQLISGSKVFDLGICVPGNMGIELMTRVPVRLFPDEKLKFQLCRQTNDFFYPINPKKPFEMLQELRFSRFQIRDGMTGIRISKSQ